MDEPRHEDEHATLVAGDEARAAPHVERIADQAHRVVDRIAGAAGPAVERLRSGIVNAGEMARTRPAEWGESCRGTVRAQPLASLAVAFVAGALVTWLARPKARAWRAGR